MKQEKQSFYVTISRREKDGTRSVIFCVVYLIMVDIKLS